ncbi:MAG: MBL fold metallo-hydrolase [Deltaproteobacteria bacterium]
MIVRNDLGEVTQLVQNIEFEGQIVYTMALYYVDGILIDTGPFKQRGEFLPVFDELDITKVINTHHHEDHIGNNPLFNVKEIPIYAHPEGIPLISDTSRWAPQLLYYQRFFFDLPPSSACKPAGDFVEGFKYRFRVIHTPGHAPDHIALLQEENGWLFTGDLFRSIKVTHLRRNEDLQLTIASLEHLLSYDFQTIFCSGGGIYEPGREKLREKIEWSKNLQANTLRLHQEGLDPELIRDTLLGPENMMAQFTEGDYTKLNMIQAIINSISSI